MKQFRDGIFRFLACGSVDDGKSTLIGHLIHLTGNLPEDQLQLLHQESGRIGTAGGELDFSLLMDGLLAEREQGITIDVAYRYFATAERKFIVADTPGHERYTRNMATGASQCSGALILLDVRQGVLRQTRRHALICALLGIRNLLFVVNKMDTVQWGEAEYRRLENDCAGIMSDMVNFGLPPISHDVVPVSALQGENLVTRPDGLQWYTGKTVLEWLHDVREITPASDLPMRLPVQYVVKIARSGDMWQNGVCADLKQSGSGTYRTYAGTLASGKMRVGDEIIVLPSGVRTRVTSLTVAGKEAEEALAPSAVAFTVDGEHDIVRGDCVALSHDRPEISSVFKTQLVWMDEHPLYAGRHYIFRSACGTIPAEVSRIKNRIDLGSYQRCATDRLETNDIGEIEVALTRSIPADSYHHNKVTGGFVLIDPITHATVACGMIIHPLRRATNVHWQREEIGKVERALLKKQKPCVIWLTGLSGSGKSTIANALECRLNGVGRHTMMLDGDNVRHGLCKDLGFTEADRVENIRRVGEVAKLMTDAGLIVITAFISPYRSERDMVRGLLNEHEFIEIHVCTSLEICEQRDPKGLYKKARAGEIPNFTGINAPYEAPERAEICIDTANLSSDESVDMIFQTLVDLGIIG